MSGTTPTGVDATNFDDATDEQVQQGIALLFGVQAGTQNTPRPQGLTVTPQQIAAGSVPTSALGVTIPTLTDGQLATSVIPPLPHSQITDFASAASAAAPVQTVAGFNGDVTASQLASVLPAAQTGTPKGFYNVATNTPALSANGGGGAVGDVYTVGPTAAAAGTMTIDGVGALVVGNRIQCINVSAGVNKWVSLETTASTGSFTDLASTGTATLNTVNASGVVTAGSLTSTGPAAASSVALPNGTMTTTAAAYSLGYPNIIYALTDENSRAYHFITQNSDGSTNGYLLSASGADQIQTASMAPTKFLPGGAFIAGFGMVKAATASTDGRALAFITADDTEYLSSPNGPYVPGTSTPLAFDIVIYGGNISGLMALVAIKKRWPKMRVCILEATAWWGGASGPGGLSFVDQSATAGLIGGDTFNTWFGAIVAIDGSSSHRYQYEPKTGMKAAQQMVELADLALTQSPINGPADVIVAPTALGMSVTGIVTRYGIITGKQFIDASYEADLGIAVLGIGSFVIGREAASSASPANGYQTSSQSTFTVTDNTAYPAVADPLETVGQADSVVQAWGIRGAMTRTAGNVLRPQKPDGYNAQDYVLQLQQWQAQGASSFMRPAAGSILYQGSLPNGKLAVNQLDLPNSATGYLTARNWARRQPYLDTVARWGMGLIYCAQNEAALMATYGLTAVYTDSQDCGYCADEFLGGPYGDGVPFQPYLRQGPHLDAQKILTQTDVVNGTAQSTSICKFNYSFDFHTGRWFAKSGTTDTIVVDGFPPLSGTAAVTQIPAECLMTAVGGSPNLLMTVCVGWDNIAHGPLRMEACYGMMGEAGGVIAAQAVLSGTAVQQYNYSQVAAALTARGSVL